MSDQFYEYDDDDDEQDDDKPERTDAEWAELRRAKKAKDKAEKELAQMKRDMAFQKAGIDTDDPKTSYFVKGYEGDISADAIREEAVKAGFITVEEEPEPDQTPVEAQARVAQAAGGIGADQPDLAQAALDQAFAEGGMDGMKQYLASQGIPIADSQ